MARTVIVADAAGPAMFGITTENVLVVLPKEVQPIEPGTEYSYVVAVLTKDNGLIIKVYVDEGQYELSVPEVVIVKLGVLETSRVTALVVNGQASGSIVKLAVRGKSYTRTSITSPVVSTYGADT